MEAQRSSRLGRGLSASLVLSDKDSRKMVPTKLKIFSLNRRVSWQLLCQVQEHEGRGYEFARTPQT